jgi:hypothetical protein
MFPKKRPGFGKRKRSDSKLGFRNKRSKPTDLKNKGSMAKSNKNYKKKPLTEMDKIKQRKEKKKKLLLKKTGRKKVLHNKSSKGRKR